MKNLFVFLLFVPMIIFSQSARFSELKFEPNSEYYNLDSATIIYPVITLKNKQAEKKINAAIRKIFISDWSDKSSLRAAISETASAGLTDFAYTIMFNRDGILSLQFDIGFTRTYPSFWQDEINFDLNTGNIITLQQMILPDKFSSFKRKVFSDKRNSIKDYKLELKEELQKKEVDTDDYRPAIDIINDCAKTVSLKKFIITDSTIQVFDNCDFPHVMQNMGTAFDLTYSIEGLKSYLKSEYYRTLRKH